MQLFTSESGATATSSTINPGEYWRRDKRLVQAKISAAANVNIQGRINSTMDWNTITTITSTGAELVDIYPEMRATIDSNTGTVDAAIDVSELERF